MFPVLYLQRPLLGRLFSLFIAGLGLVCLGRVSTDPVTSLSAPRLVLILWLSCLFSSLSAIDLLGSLGGERKWALELHGFWSSLCSSSRLCDVDPLA